MSIDDGTPAIARAAERQPAAAGLGAQDDYQPRDVGLEPRDLGAEPLAMRALAHPIRLQLIEQLTFRGAMTATQARAHVGESPSSCSFHLRTLAKYGFVEEAEGGTGRQRPWQVVRSATPGSPAPDTPAARRDGGRGAGRGGARPRPRAAGRVPRPPGRVRPEWTEAVVHANFGGWLTPDELSRIGDELLAMWRPYLDRLRDAGERPAGARLVHMFAHGFPRARRRPARLADHR